jgi:hypothetical protein
MRHDANFVRDNRHRLHDKINKARLSTIVRTIVIGGIATCLAEHFVQVVE